jgi:type VI secretion system protein ImpB
MAEQQSVAPKERINITYKPATGDAQAEIELPMKLMVVGDFTMAEDERALEEREPVSVDKDNFQKVMSEHNLHLAFNVANKLSEEGGDLGVNLKFNNMRDFEPGAVSKQVPELAKLLELREALQSLLGPLANVKDFRKKIESLVNDPEKLERLKKELFTEGGEAPKGE